jgi:hypothetical protein
MADLKLRFSAHATRRMYEWGIDVDDVRAVLFDGLVIERYPSDDPFPSRLMLGWRKDRPLHVVAADGIGEHVTVVITVYEPDPVRWNSSFQERRTP